MPPLASRCTGDIKLFISKGTLVPTAAAASKSMTEGEFLRSENLRLQAENGALALHPAARTHASRPPLGTLGTAHSAMTYLELSWDAMHGSHARMPRLNQIALLNRCVSSHMHAPCTMPRDDTGSLHARIAALEAQNSVLIEHSHRASAVASAALSGGPSAVGSGGMGEGGMGGGVGGGMGEGMGRGAPEEEGAASWDSLERRVRQRIELVGAIAPQDPSVLAQCTAAIPGATTLQSAAAFAAPAPSSSGGVVPTAVSCVACAADGVSSVVIGGAAAAVPGQVPPMPPLGLMPSLQVCACASIVA